MNDYVNKHIQIRVSKEIFKELEGLNPYLRTLLCWLCMHPPDAQEGQVMTESRIARITGYSSKRGTTRWIKDLRAAGADIELRKYSDYERQSRLPKKPPTVIVSFEHPLRDRILESRVPFDKRVNIWDGSPAKCRDDAARTSCTDMPEPVIQLCEYLNDQTKHLAKLRELALTLKDVVEADCCDQLTTADSSAINFRRSQLACLESIVQNPYSPYGPRRKTVRLYQSGPALQTLKKRYRERLAEEMRWHQVDLGAAHLTIVAAIWNVPSVQEFLYELHNGEGKSIWDYLEEKLGQPCCKEAMKAALYALVYGGGTSDAGAITKAFEDHGSKELAQPFMQIPLVNDLLQVRTERMTQIRQSLKIIDAFGCSYQLAEREGIDERSLLARESQSYEMMLMLEAAKVLMNNSRARITGWMHDGFLFSFSQEDRKLAGLVKRMQDAVQEKGKKYGIQARLEFTPCGKSTSNVARYQRLVA